MRRHLIPAFARVHLDDRLGVDGQSLVRIDDDAEETGVGLHNSVNARLFPYGVIHKLRNPRRGRGRPKGDITCKR